MRKNKSFLFQIWRSFLLFILLPVFILNIALAVMISSTKSSTRESAINQMSEAIFFLNQTIKDSLSSVQKMGANSKILKLAQISAPLTASDLGHVYTARASKVECDSGSSDSYSISLLFNKNNVLIGTQSICSNLANFYGEVYNFGIPTVEELKSEVSSRERAQFYPFDAYVFNTQEMKGILYQTTATATSNSGITTLVLIHEENLKNMFGSLAEMGGLIYIMDGLGNPLYKIGDETIDTTSFQMNDIKSDPTSDVTVLSENLLGKNNFSLYSTATMNLQVVAVLPEKSLFLKVNNFITLVILLDITTLLMCLILSGKVASHSSRELSEALDVLPFPAPKANDNPFSYIRAAVGSVVRSNTDLLKRLESQNTFLYAKFWEKVSETELLTAKELLKLGGDAGINLSQKAFALALIVVKQEYESETVNWTVHQEQREALADLLVRTLGEQSYVYPLGVEQLVVLFCFDSTEGYQEKISTSLLDCYNALQEDISPICVCSEAFTEISEITMAFSACRSLINATTYYPIASTEILWCPLAASPLDNTFYYNDDLKKQIMLAIHSGQRNLVKHCFHKIVDDNFMNTSISLEMRELLASKLKLTLLDAYEPQMNFSLSDIFAQIDGIQTDAFLVSHTLRVALDMCDYFNQKICGKSDEMRTKITEYIDSHFNEYDFGLSSVASFCNLSESYMSQLCKDLLGENFSTYVERKRMNLSSELLHTTNSSIDFIAEKTGYSNTNAFRKAFKKFYGVSPNQHRQTKK